MKSSNAISDIDADIVRLATQLRLGSGIVDKYKRIPFDDPGEFLQSLLSSIVEGRGASRITRNLRAAGLDLSKTLESFDASCLELSKKFPLDWYGSCDFVKEHQNIVLLGNPGTGKTHFATALGIEACKLGYKPIFKRMAGFIEELSAAYEDNSMKEFWKKLETVDLLILDEWGYLPTNVNGTRLLFDVINNCYENRSIIVTTNLPLAEWNRIFGDERLLIAMMDRLTHHGHLIKHTGESYRLTHSLMR